MSTVNILLEDILLNKSSDEGSLSEGNADAAGDSKKCATSRKGQRNQPSGQAIITNKGDNRKSSIPKKGTEGAAKKTKVKDTLCNNSTTTATTISTITTTTPSTVELPSRKETIPLELLDSNKKRTNFRLRKSLSQMDLKGRNQCQSPILNGQSPRYLNCINFAATRSLIPAMNGWVDSCSTTDTDSLGCNGSMKMMRNSSFQLNDDLVFYPACENENGEKVAGLRIFATIMLNAWRRRREDVRKLSEEVARLKKSSLKIKNQVHVLNSLFKIEQKQNDDLNVKLKKALEDERKMQDMYTELNNKYCHLKKDYQALEQHLSSQLRETERIETVLKETKSQLLQSLGHEKELEDALSETISENKYITEEKSVLKIQLEECKNEYSELESSMSINLASKTDEIQQLKKESLTLSEQIKNLKSFETKCKALEKITIEQSVTINSLTKELKYLQEEVNSAWPKKIQEVTNEVPRKTLQLMHMFLFYLLPHVPPPCIYLTPAAFNLTTALKYVWKD